MLNIFSYFDKLRKNTRLRFLVGVTESTITEITSMSSLSWLSQWPILDISIWEFSKMLVVQYPSWHLVTSSFQKKQTFVWSREVIQKDDNGKVEITIKWVFFVVTLIKVFIFESLRFRTNKESLMIYLSTTICTCLMIFSMTVAKKKKTMEYDCQSELICFAQPSCIKKHTSVLHELGRRSSQEPIFAYSMELNWFTLYHSILSVIFSTNMTILYRQISLFDFYTYSVLM